MNEPKNIVVRGPNWIGDQVMAIPFYQGLRSLYPSARISLMVDKKVAGLALPVSFDSLLPLGPERHTLSGLNQAAAKLREANFDFAISLPGSYSANYLFWRAGIKKRYGFFRGLSHLFLQQSIAWPETRAEVHRSKTYLSLLESLGAKPSLTVPERPGKANREKLVLVAPGASALLRVWPYFENYVARLKAKYPSHRIALVGGKGEQAWQEIGMKLGVESYIAQTSLEELVTLCRRACLVVANDSGVAHVAATLGGAPTLVLFGPGNPRHVAPLGKVYVARNASIPCVPCERATCEAPYGFQRCLTDLSLECVEGLTDEVLRS